LASSDRSTPIPYTPANPPAPNAPDLSRATWDELYRIATEFNNLGNPAALSATCSEPVTVEATSNWDRLFNENVIYDWEQPTGTLDTATGVWTCPQEGLYQIDVILEAPPFPSPATKEYTASLRTTLHPVSGGPDVVAVSQNGGIDTQSLRVNASFLRPLYRGDQLWIDADLTHATKTGTVTCLAVLNTLRVGRIKS
jgi:hypothetical protein